MLNNIILNMSATKTQRRNCRHNINGNASQLGCTWAARRPPRQANTTNNSNNYSKLPLESKFLQKGPCQFFSQLVMFFLKNIKNYQNRSKILILADLGVQTGWLELAVLGGHLEASGPMEQPLGREGLVTFTEG